MFELQRDSGDEHHHAHDQGSRERDSMAGSSFFEACRAREAAFSDAPPVTTPLPPRQLYKDMIVTNTPRNGETPKQVAARFRMKAPTGSKDCVTYCHDACGCGLRAAAEAPKGGGFTGAVDRIHAQATAAPEHNGGTNAKPSNPKDAFGILKASLTYVSLPVLMETAIGMAEGGFKYGGHNYRAIGVRASVYVDATIRHVFQFWEGEDFDSESGAKLSHITKAIASLTVLRDSMIQGNWVDDRPPPSPPGWLQNINAMMLDLAAKFPEPVARYLADGKRGPGRILES